MLRRRNLAALAVAVATPYFAPRAQAVLPPLPPITEAEEIRLAQTAAPGAISSSATLLAHRATGLEVVREGTNGYTCFVEWFELATVKWPVCYEPEISRVVVPLNQLMEKHRVLGTPSPRYRELRDSLLKTLAAPRPGGMSYRLSPEMRTNIKAANTSGPWMFLITAPNSKTEQLGIPAGTKLSTTLEPRFGLAGSGIGAYYWVDVTPLRDTLPAKPSGGTR